MELTWAILDMGVLERLYDTVPGGAEAAHLLAWRTIIAGC
jgi:hypothetical protein